MTNKHKTTLYIGVTSQLKKRIIEHRTHAFNGSFSDRYNLEYCIYYESFPTIEEAIRREKELKNWRRSKKEALVNTLNPEWNDLGEEFFP